MFWPCETRTSTCRNFATISSGLYRFLVITVLLDVKDIPQVGPLQWGRIIVASGFHNRRSFPSCGTPITSLWAPAPLSQGTNQASTDREGARPISHRPQSPCSYTHSNKGHMLYM